MSDDMHKLAEAGVAVLGDDPTMFEHHAKPGDWLCYGAIGVVFANMAHLPWWITTVAVLAVGYFANDHENKQIRKRLAFRAARSRY